MATNLQLDDALIETAVRLGGHRSKKEAVTQALVEYNLHLQQMEILDVFGSIDYDEAYHYKAQRERL
jgi:hypothetical protein